MSKSQGKNSEPTRPHVKQWEGRRGEIPNSNPFSQPGPESAALVFEALEPRLLLAADPLGITAGYAFNETSGTTAADASGHGIVGTLTNGPTFTAGKYGNAVNLDGINDYVNLGNPTALQFTSSMTLSAWVNISSFPVDDAAVISKRGSGESGYQLDITKDTGPRTVGFKLTTSSGGQMFRYGATTLQTNTWYHIAGVYNAATQTMDVYVNGALDNGTLVGTVAGAQQNSTSNVTIGRRAGITSFEFPGRIDDVRLADHALTQSQIQTDMATPLGQPQDSTAPQVQISSPAPGAQLSGIVTVTATASDNVGVAGVQFFVDGVATGPEDTTAGYALTWDTRTASNGTHALTALARDLSGNTTLSAPVSVTVSNTSSFRNEILATGFNLPTAIKFLPDGRMLVVELAGKIKVLPPPYTTPDPTPFLQLTNVGSAGVQQGVYDVALDPNFTTNHFYYIFYTAGTPNRDRLSRFTADANLTGTVPGSELILYQDPENADAEHHGGAINFGNDGKIYVTTGEHFQAAEAQDLTKPRGKILRFNPDGTVPTDNPFYDGAGPNYDAVWALGLRNPFRAYYDAPTGRLIIGDVGGNDYSTAIEEVDIGARGANYGWPNVEAPNGNPAYTAPAYYYPHNGRDAAITGGFVYHGSQFPSTYQGSYFFADYTQNWIRRLTFDANGNVNGVFNFEPADGSVDGPYGDIVYMTQGPEGAVYYVDLGYSDVGGTFGVSKIRRISFIQSNQPPVASASATPTQGPAPLTVNFSSAGSSDPEGSPLTYQWAFGDGETSTAANPQHLYSAAGQYSARLTVSDGANSALSNPIGISVGNAPTATIISPAADAPLFRAGDVINFSGDATDVEDGSLPASAYTWNIDFLHEGHVHPGTPITGVKSGSFTIPTSGHDFSGFTRYRITLTVTDSSGLQSSKSVTVFPDKVNLSFNTQPAGLTLFLDGIAHAAPFVYDTLIGFNHTIEAQNQTVGTTAYNFASWSDGGAQQHTITVPSTAQSLTANYNAVASQIAFVQANAATPQSNQSQVAVRYNNAQTAGSTNIIAIGWNNATSNITSVTDSAGNTYQLAVPTVRGNKLSQAIYYAKSIKAAAAGANNVTVAFNTATPFVDVRITEYSGLDPSNPFDVGRSAAGSSKSANSGAVTTTAPRALIFAAGTTGGEFNAAGTNFTTRIITTPDADIVEDRMVTATGSYSATASTKSSVPWVMQVAAFRAAGQAATLTALNLSAESNAQPHSTKPALSGNQSTFARDNATSNTVAFAQGSAVTAQTGCSEVAVSYANPQTAGNSNILAIGWKDTTSNITSVRDSAGNAYRLVGQVARGNGISQAIYYAAGIKAVRANTATVTFDSAAPFADIRATEYSGLDRLNPVSASKSAWGSSAVAEASLTAAGRTLVFAVGRTAGAFSAADPHFDRRINTTPDFSIAQDRLVTATGRYRATASLVGSAAWIMQIVAFKAADQAIAFEENPATA